MPNFTHDHLTKSGFVQRPDGSWHKPDPVAAAAPAKPQRDRQQKPRPKNAGKKGAATIMVKRDRRADRDPARLPQVHVVSLRRRILDSDNLTGGAKWLRDAIAKSMHIDDAELGVRWHFSQAEVLTKEEEGTIVRIEDPTNTRP